MGESEKRILVVSQQFPPDTSGHASRMMDMTSNLDAVGWNVDVLAPPPSFPHGEFDQQWYRTQRDTIDGVNVRRIWSWQPTESDPGVLSRLAYYITFALHATMWLLFNSRRYDVVLTTTPPIFTGLAGFVPSLTGTRWVVDVRDLWINASVSLGFIGEGGILERSSRGFQRQVLRRGDTIAVTTEMLGEALCEQYGAELAEKIIVVPNGVDMSRFGPGVESIPEASRLSVTAGETGETTTESVTESAMTSADASSGDRPVIVYVGNIGHAQDLESCIRAMSSVSHDAVLRLVGGGDIVPYLRTVVEEEGVEDRVEFVDPVPREEIPRVLAEADIGIAPLVKNEELAYAMPTKVYEYLGSGLPIVVTGCGELERFVDESGGGVHVDNDPEEIAATFEKLLADDAMRASMGTNGHEYVRNRYDRRRIAERLDDHVTNLVNSD
ncbi:glycosyltransferase family 4 protein [Halogeometricum limi]|uniref:Glycosyltransferase involved in cell wall bisynthesis n=1 Tax=Halogeometricum limi TaxID=555875 RepID=A0A1I6IKJ5_9EURY|nr:glycosyltransferase family 4 protein [Halogeometricum limi]SFR67218.1 Glycosyltransferase involved in cell wall bisynthesis [Halogeometricum limi]